MNREHSVNTVKCYSYIFCKEYLLLAATVRLIPLYFGTTGLAQSLSVFAADIPASCLRLCLRYLASTSRPASHLHSLHTELMPEPGPKITPPGDFTVLRKACEYSLPPLIKKFLILHSSLLFSAKGSFHQWNADKRNACLRSISLNTR